MRASSKLYKAARTSRNLEVLASGSPTRIMNRLINIFVWRKIGSIVGRILR